MSRADLRTFWTLKIDHSAIGLERAGAEYNDFCTPVGAEAFACLGCDGIHFALLPGDETIYCVDPAMGEPGTYVLPVVGDFRQFLSYVLFCGDANPLTQIWWLTEPRFRAFLQEEREQSWEGMEDFLAQKRAALGAVAAAFHLEPADPWKPVKALQAAFDPSGLVFSDAYYDVLGLENPRDAGKSRQERLGEFETVVFPCANGEEE